MPANAIIELTNVHKGFDENPVLKDVTFSIAKGQTTVFVGPSGVGKSVLIKLMVGLMEPDSGSVVVDGQDLSKLSRQGLFDLRKRLGMLFQDAALFDSLSILENVAFPLRRHRRLGESEIRDIVAARLRDVGLSGIEYRFPSELSGGMRKRVGLARALVLDPSVIFFDEPTSGLDPVTAAAIDELILATQSRLGATFIVISHDVASTRKVAHRLGMLYKGELLEYGEAGAVLNSVNPVVRQFFDRKSDGPIQIV